MKTLSSEMQAQRSWFKLHVVSITSKSLPYHNYAFYLIFLYPWAAIHPGKLFPCIWSCSTYFHLSCYSLFSDCLPYLSATLMGEVSPFKAYFNYTSVIWNVSLLWTPLYFSNVVRYSLSFLMSENVSLFRSLGLHFIHICIIHDTQQDALHWVHFVM